MQEADVFMLAQPLMGPLEKVPVSSLKSSPPAKDSSQS